MGNGDIGDEVRRREISEVKWAGHHDEVDERGKVTSRRRVTRIT